LNNINEYDAEKFQNYDIAPFENLSNRCFEHQMKTRSCFGKIKDFFDPPSKLISHSEIMSEMI
jgi:hypothetical protein